MAKKTQGPTAQGNALPVVVIETPTNVGYVDTPFQINLTLSYDPDGEIVRTVVQWGDGSENTAMGRPEWASHRYENPGSYLITVACMDDERDINQLAFGTALVDIIVPIPFEVDDQQYVAESPTGGQPVYVALDQPVTITGGAPPYDPPVYDPDDLPAGNLFPIGETVVKFYVQDSKGQRAWAEAYVTVEDTQIPVEELIVTAPADEYITTVAQSAPVDWDDATVIGGVPPYVLRYEANGAAVRQGSMFPAGATVVTAIAVDSAGTQATDTFTVTVEHVSPIPPGNNDQYFASRKAHPSCVFNYALVTDAEIAKYRKQAYNAYQPYYDAAMNAMRISIPPGTQGSIANQMWLPCSLAEPGQLIFIWDELDGPNWNISGGFTGWKYYQIRRDADKIWFEIGAGPVKDDPKYALGKARIRQYATVGPHTILGNYSVTDEYGTSQYNSDSVRSAVNPPKNYLSLRGKPTRHMIVANQDPADPKYVTFDYYASDLEHAIIQIHKGVEIACPDKAGVAGKGRPRHFDWEINTSLSRPQPGPEACMWARYLTIHRGVSDPLTLFQPITGW